MTIALSVFLIIWVLWVLSIISMGEYENIVPFTCFFVIAPVILAILIVLCPLAVIFSKAAREEAKKKLNSE